MECPRVCAISGDCERFSARVGDARNHRGSPGLSFRWHQQGQSFCASDELAEMLYRMRLRVIEQCGSLESKRSLRANELCVYRILNDLSGSGS